MGHNLFVKITGVINDSLVGNNDSLVKAIHAPFNFYKNVSLVKNRGNIVLFYYGVRDVLYRDVHVFIAV